MANAFRYRRCGFLLPALALVGSALFCAPYAAAVQDHPPAAKPPATPAAMAKYRQELAAYLQARDAYQTAAKPTGARLPRSGGCEAPNAPAARRCRSMITCSTSRRSIP